MNILLAFVVVMSLTDSVLADRLVAGHHSNFESANMTPIPRAGGEGKRMAASCKSEGEKCSGVSDKSCCPGLACHSGGTAQIWICF